MSAPLTGLRVIDFGQGAAGPYCGQLLADFGADVIKVEPPRGDWGRTLGRIDPITGLSSTHLALNRNKRSVVLDLTQPRGLELAESLCVGADVVLESFRPGVMERLRLDAASLRARTPRLVYVSITGFGATGPLASRPASDSMMQPFAGLMSVIGGPDDPPMRVGNVVSDMLAAGNAFSAVLLALLRRSTTGIGGHVEVNLLDSLVAFQATGLTEYLVTGEPPPRPGNRHPLIGASGVAACADGYFAVGVLDHYWPTFCRTLGLDGLLHDARFAEAAARLKHQAELWSILEPVFAARTVQDLIDQLSGVGIVCGPVNDYSTLVQEPQVQHNRLITRVGDVPSDMFPMIAAPLGLDGVEPRYERPPALGSHTAEVLTELGVDPEELETLLTARVAYQDGGGPP
jgi:crotonobetainyl-CoA:carnitine CoA-transferase CaiB-like acyl-CoA transferase